jgi:transcription elongation factor Elf1
MSGLFDNAVGSIRVGVQDYGSPDDHRHISAVRNYYAGILLLAKEVLVRRFPNEDPDKLIAANLKPVVGVNGTVDFVPATQNTIDFATIGRRFDDLGIVFDHKLLKGLNSIRNDVEHKFSALSRPAIIEAIAKGFPAAGQLFRLIGEDPVAVLGDEWAEMLETRELFDAELGACQATLDNIAWRSATVLEAKLICPECDSNLIQQADSQNTDQDEAMLSCRACGAQPDMADVIEKTLDDALAAEAYLRAKDAGEDGPVYDCPSCDKAAFIDFEDGCAVCGYTTTSSGFCAVCGEPIPLSELLAYPDIKLCSYHQYAMNKND